MNNRRLALALGIPLLGLCLLVVRAEVERRRGTEWLVPITGYDPRDLLSGHYLRYRYVWNFQGASACTSDDPGGCCLCLDVGPGGSHENPPVRRVDCEAADTCAAVLVEGAMSGPQRYYIPEERGAALEQAVRDSHAAILLSVGRNRQAAIKDLYLDGRSWREAVRERR